MEYQDYTKFPECIELRVGKVPIYKHGIKWKY